MRDDAIQALIDLVPISASDASSFDDVDDDKLLREMCRVAALAQAQHDANRDVVAALNSALDGRAAEVAQLERELREQQLRFDQAMFEPTLARARARTRELIQRARAEKAERKLERLLIRLRRRHEGRTSSLTTKLRDPLAARAMLHDARGRWRLRIAVRPSLTAEVEVHLRERVRLPGDHEWTLRDGWSVCLQCGVVRSRDRDTVCKGTLPKVCQRGGSDAKGEESE